MERRKLKVVVATVFILSVLLATANLTSERQKPLRRPNLTELQTFLEADQTDKNHYVLDVYLPEATNMPKPYICLDFSRDLKKNAAHWKINMSIVIILVMVPVSEEGQAKYGLPKTMPFGGHAINGVTLSNGTFVLIEPQTDLIFPYSDLETYIRRLFDQPVADIEEVIIQW